MNCGGCGHARALHGSGLGTCLAAVSQGSVCPCARFVDPTQPEALVERREQAPPRQLQLQEAREPARPPSVPARLQGLEHALTTVTRERCSACQRKLRRHPTRPTWLGHSRGCRRHGQPPDAV